MNTYFDFQFTKKDINITKLRLSYLLRFLVIIIVFEFFIHKIDIDTDIPEILVDVAMSMLVVFPSLIIFVILPYTKQINRKINEQNSELNAIWNVEKNIMVLMDGKELKEASKSFFEFFNEYKTVDEFNKEHKCLCDFFEKTDEKDYITKYIDNIFWTEYISAHQEKNFKTAIKREDGVYIFSIHAQKISTVNSENIIVTFNDVTEQENYYQFLESYQETLQKQIQEETEIIHKKDEIMLAQSRQAAMGDMISMIAHQWRQPITAIGMGAQNLQLDIELEDIDPKRFDEKLSKIVEQTHFLSKTIDDFRDFLKPNKKPKKCKLSEILQGALNIIDKSLANNNIKLDISHENNIEITTFRNEVIQVLLNVINNAKDVIQINEIKNALILINVGNDEKMAYFKICDNAGGIPENILPRIFEPYFTTKEEKGGTGLGLYMSKMIIEKHIKGSIKVENINGGACFIISIPLKDNNGI